MLRRPGARFQALEDYTWRAQPGCMKWTLTCSHDMTYGGREQRLAQSLKTWWAAKPRGSHAHSPSVSGRWQRVTVSSEIEAPGFVPPRVDATA